MAKLSEQTAAKTIDVKGQICPYPIINTRQELAGMKKGEILLVITDNPDTAEENLPRHCRNKKQEYEIIEKEDGGRKVWHCYIRK